MAEKYVSTAKVIDGVLILSLPDALTPVVWQMELGQSKSSALEIRDNGDSKFLLALKTPRQDVLEIATYSNRDLAIKALLVASQAMEKAHGQLKAATPNAYPVPALSPSSIGTSSLLKGALSFLLKLIGGIILLALLLLILSIPVRMLFTPSSPLVLSNDTGNSPVSADEFLNGR